MKNSIFLFKPKKSITQKRKRFSSLFSMSFILILLTLTTWQCRKDDFTGEVVGVCPKVTVTNPTNGAINVVNTQQITATFNTTMDVKTINETTFILKKGVNLISGTVAYSGTTATFIPTDLLEANTVYAATIKRSSKDLMGNMMAKDTTWNFNTGSTPVVVLTNPLDGASDVYLNTAITADFSTEMDATTINATSFVVMQGITVVSGTISYLGNKATFTPANLLLENKVYSATIKKEVTDVAGNSMTKDTTWSFATGMVIAPVVVATDPMNGAVDVPTNKIVRATFSKTMDDATINSLTFKLMNGTTPVLGSVTYVNNEGFFTPTNPLLNGTTYNAIITTDATDLVGNPLASDKEWSFTTVAATNQYTVALSSNIAEAGVISGAGLFNAGSSVTVLALTNAGYIFNNWTESGTIVSASANYNFTINSDRTLVANFTAIIAGPPGVDLGSAGDFAILAGSGVSNTGVSTIITGDVGSFPTSTMNGLLSGNVIGILYTVADPIVGQAKVDLTTAYNDAQGRSTNAISLPGQLGGLTLAPGLYVNASTSGISGTGANGILTLDAGGNPNAVWIFKMGSTLITDPGTSIVLAGGAQAKNIYWSVGSSATLGTNSIFYGNILAEQSVTLTTGATLIGRALTRTGAVTLDTNTVTKP